MNDNSENFDKQFTAHQDAFNSAFKVTAKTVQRSFVVVAAILALQVLVGLAMVAGIGYVVWHFISKVW
jgi:nitrate reductase NapE component